MLLFNTSKRLKYSKYLHSQLFINSVVSYFMFPKDLLFLNIFIDLLSKISCTGQLEMITSVMLSNLWIKQQNLVWRRPYFNMSHPTDTAVVGTKIRLFHKSINVIFTNSYFNILFVSWNLEIETETCCSNA